MKITDKQLAAYAEGKVTKTERLVIRRYLMQNPEKIHSVAQMMNKDFQPAPKQTPVKASRPKKSQSQISRPQRSHSQEPQNLDEGSDLFMDHACAFAPFDRHIHMGKSVYESYEAEEDAADMECSDEVCCDSECHEEDASFFSRMDSLLDELADDDAQEAADAQDEPTDDDAQEADEQNENFSILPMTATAAQDAVDNACVIRCEGYALRRFSIEIDDETLLRESKEKGWFCPEGIKLHRIGCLSGLHGMGVAHRYHCTVADIRQALRNQQVVIAVVSAERLLGQTDAGDGQPNHAVVVTAAEEKSVTLRDFSTPQEEDTYDTDVFCRAWDNSSRYLVLLHNSSQYNPHPIELSDIPLSLDLIELREAIAENAHDVWALNRMKEGWTYGEVRDDENKRHPDLVPYNLLPESEKEYDREMAMNTIRLVRKLGWDLLKRNKEK
ncbi:MAG: RyR domain-containing protein [Alloprevotella sp.]